jgi:hypothetical protein
MSNDFQDDSRQLQAVASLPQDMMLLKMENEQIFAVARTQPRDPMKIVKQLAQLIEAYPAAADEAIYSKPVGTVIQVTCPNEKCGIKYEVNSIDQETACPICDTKAAGAPSRKVKKFAEGLSIRAAESIRSIYGYTRLATTTEQFEDGKVKLTGTIVDYSAGNLTSDERIVTPWYKSRSGGMTRTPEDRFLNVVVKAEKSKLRRDIILDNTPAIVKAMFRDMCEQKLLQLVAPEVIEQRIIPAFAEYGISQEQLDQIIGRPHKLGWREQERMMLRKILNALKNEETTARELLDGLASKPTNTSVPNAGVTIGDLMGADQPTPQDQAEAAPNASKRSRKVKKADPEPVAPEPKQEAVAKTESPKVENEPSQLDPAAWLADKQRRLRQCHTILEFFPLSSEIAKDPMLAQITPEQQEELAQLAMDTQERLR